MNLEPAVEKFSVDVGHGEVYISDTPYDRPFFFESAVRRMMKEHSSKYVTLKSWGGEFFQFSLDTYHGNTCLLITSTMGDCAFFPAQSLSLEKAKRKAVENMNSKYLVKGSFSGYSTFGKTALAQYHALEKHLEEQEMYLTDDTLKAIFKELRRRAKDE